MLIIINRIHPEIVIPGWMLSAISSQLSAETP
jgi:hypothetical protein